MPVRKKSPSKMLASLAKRPDHNKMNKIKKLTNLSNLKTNAQLNEEKRKKEAAKKILKGWRYTKTPEFKAKRSKLENELVAAIVNADNNINRIKRETAKKVNEITGKLKSLRLNNKNLRKR